MTYDEVAKELGDALKDASAKKTKLDDLVKQASTANNEYVDASNKVLNLRSKLNDVLDGVGKEQIKPKIG